MMQDRPTVRAAGNGCYEASRAAALSGVPKTTVYWWASHGVVVPSLSPVREKLWSYSDLMALRIVSWLRHTKEVRDADPLPASPMPEVRRALRLIDELELDVWHSDSRYASPLLVDASGAIFVRAGENILDARGNPTLLPASFLNLTAPFHDEGAHGPDLIRPRPHLRIVPDKVAGEPHIEQSRLTTQTVAALAGRSYATAQIAAMYDVDPLFVQEAIDLEAQLRGALIAA